MKRRLKVAGLATAVFAFAVFLNNTSLLAPIPTDRGELHAHRGVHQTFTTEGLKADSFTATMIYVPEHQFLENTLASITEAFRLGADEVEIDIHPTSDGQFAVFHDWTLDCRTNGTGVTREQTMAYLKTLDIGYGYSADDGKIFPFRGEGIGLMPTLDEVLHKFPGKRFSINIKSNDVEEARLLTARLSQLGEEERRLLSLLHPVQPTLRLPQNALSRHDDEQSKRRGALPIGVHDMGLDRSCSRLLPWRYLCGAAQLFMGNMGLPVPTACAHERCRGSGIRHSALPWRHL